MGKGSEEGNKDLNLLNCIVSEISLQWHGAVIQRENGILSLYI